MINLKTNIFNKFYLNKKIILLFIYYVTYLIYSLFIQLFNKYIYIILSIF